MHRIVFTGAQGTGKTTVLNHFKENNFNVITEVVRNLAKEGVNINENGDDESQTIIFNKYYELLSTFTPAGYISDRSLVDVAAYTKWLVENGKVSAELFDSQIEEIRKFVRSNPDVMYCYYPIEFDVVDDGVRSTDETFRRDIDIYIQEVFELTGIAPIKITGSVEDRVAKVTRVYNWIREGISLHFD